MPSRRHARPCQRLADAVCRGRRAAIPLLFPLLGAAARLLRRAQVRGHADRLHLVLPQNALEGAQLHAPRRVNRFARALDLRRGNRAVIRKASLYLLSAHDAGALPDKCIAYAEQPWGTPKRSPNRRAAGALQNGCTTAPG